MKQKEFISLYKKVYKNVYKKGEFFIVPRPPPLYIPALITHYLM